MIDDLASALGRIFAEKRPPSYQASPLMAEKLGLVKSA